MCVYLHKVPEHCYFICFLDKVISICPPKEYVKITALGLFPLLDPMLCTKNPISRVFLFSTFFTKAVICYCITSALVSTSITTAVCCINSALVSTFLTTAVIYL